MKTLIVLISLSLTFIFSVEAKSIAVASKVIGNAFYMIDGKTKNIKSGTILPLGSEIYTELGAELSLNDYYNHVFHLSGSGHISLSKNLVELKSGYLWAQSLAKSVTLGPMRIITANAEVEFSLGEGIISFDGLNSKSQLLAVKGDFIFRNSTKNFSEVDVSEGKFSYISTGVDEGKPRMPTSVGYTSYQKLTSLFPKVKPLDGYGHKDAPRVDSPIRKIASATESMPKSNFERALEQKELGVTQNNSLKQSTGEIIFVKTKSKSRLKKEASKRGRLIASYQEKFKPVVIKKPRKRWKASYSVKSPVVVKIFGQVKKSDKVIKRIPASTVAKPKMRTPASVAAPAPSLSKGKTSFETHLMKEYQNQMRHKKELNSLIDELKSVDIDYQKEY